jgi:hypothetical protein
MSWGFWDGKPPRELREKHAEIWARNERGEITIRQAKEECASFAREFYGLRRELDAHPQAALFALDNPPASSSVDDIMRRDRAMLDAYYAQYKREAAERAARVAEKAEARKAWRVGVAKIMAEVRRRETVRAIAEFGL